MSVCMCFFEDYDDDEENQRERERKTNKKGFVTQRNNKVSSFLSAMAFYGFFFSLFTSISLLSLWLSTSLGLDEHSSLDDKNLCVLFLPSGASVL